MSNAYRDDEAPLHERIEQLRREQEAVRARAKELREAVSRGDEIDREIAETQRRIDELRGPAMELERLRIASPCKASWDEMVGDERVRFCGSCQKNVYNLSGMRREEATALIKDRTGEICVRMYRRADGTVLTADCPVGATKKNVRRLAVLATGGGALALAGAGLWARMGEPTEQHLAGAISMPIDHEPRVEAGGVQPPEKVYGPGGLTARPEPSMMGSTSLPVQSPPPTMGKPMMGREEVGQRPRRTTTESEGTAADPLGPGPRDPRPNAGPARK